jgi:hypothetical protein
MPAIRSLLLPTRMLAVPTALADLTDGIMVDEPFDRAAG